MFDLLLGDGERPVYQRCMHLIGVLCCAAIAAFILATTAIGRLPEQAQYGVVLLLALVAVFMLRPGLLARNDQVGTADAVLSLGFVVITLFSGGYFLMNYSDIAALREGLPNTWDLWAYGLGTLAVLEGARRAEGWVLLSIAIAAILYMFFGDLLPGVLQHRPFYFDEVLEISYSYQGIYGVAFAAVVNVVWVFVILGVALQITGAGNFFNFIGLRLSRGRKSGAAQTAIIASSLFGSVNGSAPANVAATGVLTIPMMKRAGYSPGFAGGVESTSSCVGQILPPIMGVGAFIMSEITGIPYATIMLAAVVPAFLFIISLLVAAALEAGRLDLQPLEAADGTEWTRERVAQAVVLLVGFGTLLVLLFSGYAPTFCGLAATGTVLGVAMLFRETRPNFRNLTAFVIDGGRGGLSVALSCAAIGIVIGAVTTTGVGIKLNQLIVAIGQDQLLLALMLAALCSIVLGMGLPTAASYLMVVFVAGPAIMKLGIDMLSTHLFVFYYAVLSAVTPPVALAVFAAAAIAKEGPLKIAGNALRLCFVGFVIPIIWIYHPEVLLTNVSLATAHHSLFLIVSMIVVIVAVTAAYIGFFRRNLALWQRGILLVAGLFGLHTNWVVTAVGCGTALAMLAFLWSQGPMPIADSMARGKDDSVPTS